MRVALVGFDVEGKASLAYFQSRGDTVTVCDQKTDVFIPDGVASQLGENYLDSLDAFDLVVRTAGMSPKIIHERYPNLGDKLTTHVDTFLKDCPTKHVIGVTGTKGKGTTSTLIAKILEAAGKSVYLGGNIGVPPLTFLPSLTHESWVVLELSSFQLVDMHHSPHIAVCLMVVPEHLNWHGDMDEYMSSKGRLFAQQTAEDIAIYFSESPNSRTIASAGDGRKTPYFAQPGATIDNGCISINGQVICMTDELQLLGQHNWQNVCAAVTAVWQITQNVQAIHKVLSSFSGLEHRIEFVRNMHAIDFYNDSYAAGLHASIAAIEAIPNKKVLILGGFDRMLPLEHFGTYVKEHEAEFRNLLLIGQSASRLADTLKKSGFTNYILDDTSKTMPEIVAKVITLALPGDAIVLSPGFASFDMFKNFEQRGLQFKAAVQALK